MKDEDEVMDESDDSDDDSDDSDSGSIGGDSETMEWGKKVEPELRRWIVTEECRRDVADEYFNNPPQRRRELSSTLFDFKRLDSRVFSAHWHLLRQLP